MPTRLGQLLEVGVRRPIIALLAVALLSVPFASGIRELRLDSAIESTLPEDSPVRISDRRVRSVFDARPLVFVGLVSKSDAFTRQTLDKLQRLTAKLEEMTLPLPEFEAIASLCRQAPSSTLDKLQGLLNTDAARESWPDIDDTLSDCRSDSNAAALDAVLEEMQYRLFPFDDVISLSSVDAIEAESDELLVGPAFDEVPSEPAALAALRRRVMSDRLLRGRLVSEDGSSLAILATLSFDHSERPELTAETSTAVREAVRPFEGPEQIFVSGVPVVNSMTAEAMNTDLGRLVPLVLLTLLAVLYISFRRLTATLMPLAVVMLSLLWTLGVMAMAGRPITMVTTSLPIMLLAIGIADGIHLMTHYADRMKEGSSATVALRDTVNDLAAPIFMTSLTTAAGFGSLAVATLPSIRDFGIFTAFGTMAALAVTLVVLPALMRLSGRGAEVRSSTVGDLGLAERVALAMSNLSSRRSWPLLLVSVVLVAASLGLSTRLQVGSKMTGNFPPDSEIFRAGEVLNRKFGGTQILDIVVDSQRSGGAKDPSALAWVGELQRDLESSPAVGKTFSLADLIERMNFVMHNGDPAYDRLPHDKEILDGSGGETVEVRGRDQIAQYLLLYENAGGGELDDVVDFDYRELRIVAQIRGDDHVISRAARDRARLFAQNRPAPGPVSFAGCASLCVFVDDLIIPSQVRSLVTALALVTLLLGVLFKSARLAVIGVAPMVVTISLSFGGMWLLDVPLDSITALIASIVLGIGVDHAIHFLAWYRKQRSSGLSHGEALADTRRHTARAILLNAVTVGLGFLVLTGSTFFPVRVIGAFVAATMLLSAVATMTLLPALLAGSFAEKNWH